MTQSSERRLPRTLFRIVLLLLASMLAACGGCDALDPANYIDADQFRPDVQIPDPEMGTGDMGMPDDSGRVPKDTDFVFDFGEDPDLGEQPFLLTAVVPNFGPVEGGTQVRIQGTGLKEESTVLVGSREMATDLSSGTLVGRVPPGTGPGPVSVKVISPDGETRVIIDGYRYVENLRVDEVTPSRVPTTGGVEVTVRGAGFAPQMGVSFSGNAALRVTYVDETLLRVLTPPRPRGFADLRVTTPAETVEIDDAVQYYEPLRIDAVEPASGGVAGGDDVVVRGAGFTSDSEVRFGPTPATVTGVDAQAGTINVTTPPGAAGVVDVFVQNGVDSAVRQNGYYYRADENPFVAGVTPRYGPTTGGNTARVIGYGLDTAGAEIRFGAAPATISQAEPSWADVVVPPGVAGVVDVSLHDGATELGRAGGAYEYVPALGITGATPAAGPDTGGTNVTLTGRGFTGTESVLVGGAPADFSVVSDTEITVTTPPHIAGTVDIVVSRDGIDATLEDGFTYQGTVEVWGFTPVRGSVAGGTYVEVRGRGFFGELGVTLDSTPGTQVQRIDRNNLRFYTPPHAPGEVDLTVHVDAASAVAPYTFLYFDPASRFGGASGGPVAGAVNVTVFENGGGPIENSFVMLSTRADTPYQGWTNALGQVTLSGPDVVGSQTTTATAAGYSSATIQTVDAENITLFLNRLDPASGSGTFEPPPFGMIRGNIRATGKLADPDESHTYDMAVVGTTTKSVFGRNPPPGPDAIVVGEGRYAITTRVGDMAVIGLCGTYDQTTNTFTPQLLAVERFVFVANQDDLEIDLFCDIPLDQTHSYKLVNAPYAPDGPNTNLVEVYWNFGFEGFFPSPTFGQGFDSLVAVPNQPALEGDIADISFTAVGGAFTGFSAPLSQATRTNITDVSPPITLPVLLDVPELMAPLPGGVVGADGMIRLQAAGPYLPDFRYIVLRNDMGIPVWTFFLPGDENEVKLPEFPDFSSLPPAQRPNPITGGQLFMTVVSARLGGGHVYETLNYRDIDPDIWEAYSLVSWVIRLK